jgi:hypothetical protein
MIWLEINTFCHPHHRDFLRHNRSKGFGAVITLRSRHGLTRNNECFIQIQWISQSELEGRSPLGRALSRAIGDLGLVTQ